MDDLYATKYPEDVYTREEQEHIRVLNLKRKELQQKKNQRGLNQKDIVLLNALRWAINLIEEITLD